MKWLALVMMVLVLVPFSLAANTVTPSNRVSPGTTGQDAASQQQAIMAAVSTEIGKQVADANEKTIASLKQYQDENFVALDGQMKVYMTEVEKRAIVGIIGLNFVVAGIVFYFANKTFRQYSYESVRLRRQKEFADRDFIAKNINEMRAKLDVIQSDMQSKYDPALFTIGQLAAYQQYQQYQDSMRMQYQPQPYYLPDQQQAQDPRQQFY